MPRDDHLPFVREIMQRFAVETGLRGEGRPRRYLWTDAFAVCNYLELKRLTGEDRYTELALDLVDQVHRVLGRHRDDDPRSGWLSGLDEEEGGAHPTRGGLRIGKPLGERRAGEPYDNGLEWDRDGQYFHYLSKWIHALHRVSAATGKGVYNSWAVELAAAAHRAFFYEPPEGGPKRMYWKMSIDLSRPLVPAMGRHDPLEGYLAYLEVQEGDPAVLAAEIDEIRRLCRGRDWFTDDPLGLGGLLCDALQAVQLIVKGNHALAGLPDDLLDAARHGLKEYTAGQPLDGPAESRLAFRELGLATGLQALDRIGRLIPAQPALSGETDSLVNYLDQLGRYRELAGKINHFWLAGQNQEASSWTAHQDINAVMLATSLAPDGFCG